MEGSDAKTTVEVYVTNKKEGQIIRYTLCNADGEVFATHETEATKMNFRIKNAHLWQARKDPYLYSVKAELVENGEVETAKARDLIGRYVVPMLEQNVDHIVLGCTHYPFLERVIREFTGDKVEIVNPAPAIARRAGEVLSQKRAAAMAKKGETAKTCVGPESNTFVTTGDNIAVMEAMVAEIAPMEYMNFALKKI
jgi:glutamate racemase